MAAFLERPCGQCAEGTAYKCYTINFSLIGDASPPTLPVSMGVSFRRAYSLPDGSRVCEWWGVVPTGQHGGPGRPCQASPSGVYTAILQFVENPGVGVGVALRLHRNNCQLGTNDKLQEGTGAETYQIVTASNVVDLPWTSNNTWQDLNVTLAPLTNICGETSVQMIFTVEAGAGGVVTKLVIKKLDGTLLMQYEHEHTGVSAGELDGQDTTGWLDTQTQNCEAFPGSATISPVQPHTIGDCLAPDDGPIHREWQEGLTPDPANCDLSTFELDDPGNGHDCDNPISHAYITSNDTGVAPCDGALPDRCVRTGRARQPADCCNCGCGPPTSSPIGNAPSVICDEGRPECPWPACTTGKAACVYKVTLSGFGTSSENCSPGSSCDDFNADFYLKYHEPTASPFPCCFGEPTGSRLPLCQLGASLRLCFEWDSVASETTVALFYPGGTNTICGLRWEDTFAGQIDCETISNLALPFFQNAACAAAGPTNVFCGTGAAFPNDAIISAWRASPSGYTVDLGAGGLGNDGCDNCGAVLGTFDMDWHSEPGNECIYRIFELEFCTGYTIDITLTWGYDLFPSGQAAKLQITLSNGANVGQVTYENTTAKMCDGSPITLTKTAEDWSTDNVCTGTLPATVTLTAIVP